MSYSGYPKGCPEKLAGKQERRANWISARRVSLLSLKTSYRTLS